MVNSDIASRTTLSILRDKMPTHSLFDKKYRISLSTKEELVKGEVHRPRDGEKWFTDSFRNKEKAEAGLYRRRSGMVFTIPMGSYGTVLQSVIMTMH